MAAETKAIAIPAAAWTLVADSKSNVLIKMRNTGVTYLFVGPAIPVSAPTDSSDVMTMGSGEPASLSGLSAGDKVYLFSTVANRAQVIRS